jgi:4-hydroxy-tetrahydrodipicolinate synthase
LSEAEPLSGLWCATLTPLNPAGGIDHERLAAHVGELIGCGVDGIVLFGTTGEGPSFSVAERTAALDELLTAGIPNSRLAVATGCPALPDTVTLIRHALASGCPRCLVLPPYFWKDLDDNGLFDYYAALIEAVCDPRLRLYLYHIPELSAVPIQPELLARLDAAYPGIIAGIKDSGGDFSHTRTLQQCAPDLAVLTGHESDVADLMRAGGAGTICGAANLLPGVMAALVRLDASAGAEPRIRSFLEIVHPYPFVPAFKAILAAQRADDAWLAVRPPLRPLPDDARRTLLAALRRADMLDAS